MNRTICERTRRCFIAVLLSWTACALGSDTANAQIQMTTAQARCLGNESEPCTASAGQQAAISTLSVLSLGPAQVGVVAIGGTAFGLLENAEVVKGQPYQEQAVTEITQTLADGSHIAQTNMATVGRDSEGRIVRIQKLSTIGPWKSASDSTQESGTTLTSIFDPVAKTHIDYTSDAKTAHMLTMPALPVGAVMLTATGSGPSVSSAGREGPSLNVVLSGQGHAGASQETGEPQSKTESLGTKTIEGLQVDGTRTATTIPTGAIGNDKEIVVTRETWFSQDLKVVLLSTQDDPRFGQTKYSLKNIERSEPDPTLFQVPAGYKIVKIPGPPQAH